MPPRKVSTPASTTDYRHDATASITPRHRRAARSLLRQRANDQHAIEATHRRRRR